MALAALAGEVIGRGLAAVAAYAISGVLGCMVKAGRCPGRGAVAFAALAREMIGRFFVGMATDAIGSPGSRMVKCGWSPGDRRMAG